MSESLAPLFKGLIWFIAVYPLRAVMRLSLTLIGFLMLPFVLPFSCYAHVPVRPTEASKRHTAKGWHYKRLPWLFDRVWGNYKYGAEGNWFWYEKYKGSFWGAYLWLAIRNPANNLDKLTEIKNPVFYGSPEVSDVKGIAGCQFVVDGWKAGLYFIIPLGKRWCFRCRLGYKIDADDRYVRLSYLPPVWPQKFGR